MTKCNKMAFICIIFTLFCRLLIIILENYTSKCLIGIQILIRLVALKYQVFVKLHIIIEFKGIALSNDKLISKFNYIILILKIR